MLEHGVCLYIMFVYVVSYDVDVCVHVSVSACLLVCVKKGGRQLHLIYYAAQRCSTGLACISPGPYSSMLLIRYIGSTTTTS